MQSGISASQELRTAFQELVSNPSQRGLIAGIANESLVPLQSIPSESSDFSSDLKALQPLLTEKEAAYIILRRYPEADGFVAVTYVPDAAPVRQKTLFASARLTLVRELGTERFRDTLFATTKAELTKEGWGKHDAHGESKAPLTEEEQSLEGIRQAEAEESRGTGVRRGHVSTKVSFPVTDEVVAALKALPAGSNNLVQVAIDVPKEIMVLVSTSSTPASSLSTTISSDSPRFSFFRYEHVHEGSDLAPIVFFYTCPSGSRIKERMVYASSTAFAIQIAKDQANLDIEKRIEATSPDEITEERIYEELHPKQAQKTQFDRPKRPGRR